MDSRAHILDAINRRQRQEIMLPSLEHSWTVYVDRRRQFAEALRGVGGECIVAENVDELNRRLSELPAYAEAEKRISTVSGAAQSSVELQAIEDPHHLEDVDFAILPGHFGVAENGAVWTTDAGLKHRVLYFIAQHVALVVPGEAIVNNMHEAYQRVASSPNARWARERVGGFGTFISGPSKTADIEQSLVIGAHGARSLTVFLLDSLRPDDLSPEAFQ